MSLKTDYDAFIGLDVQKDATAVPIANPERGGKIRFYANFTNDHSSIGRLFKKMEKKYHIVAPG